jgi:hypothetical protein
MKIRPVFLLALLLVPGSCQDDPPGQSTPIPLEKMAGELKSALCSRIYSCCSAEQRKGNARIGQDVASCEAMLDRKATLLLGDVHESVEGGRLVYHPAALTSCLTRLRSASCDELRMPADNVAILTQACEGVFEPKVAPGGACSESWDCIGGWCQGDQGNLLDQCTALRADGEDCDEGLECRSGLCTDDLVCAPVPAGRGSICAVGTEIVGQHGAAP